MPMEDNALGRRRRLLAGLALLAAAGLLAFLCRRYLYNVLLGPFPIDRATLVALADADDRLEYFVTVQGDAVEVLFPRAYTAGSEPYSKYALLQVGDRWVLLRVPTGQEGTSQTGTLEGLSAFEREHVLGPRAHGTAGPRTFLPFRLEATRYFRVVGWLLAVLPVAGLTALGGGLVMSTAVLRTAAKRPASTAP
jgi:hypothetical protein